MNKNDLAQRKPTRLKTFDYNTGGAYFITICTEKRSAILSRIVGGDVLDAPNIELLSCGKIVEKTIRQLNGFYEHITIDSYVIMPNHIHMIFSVPQAGASRTSPPTKTHSCLSQFISTLKRFCNREYGKNIWQRGFYDHVICSREDYEEHLRYVEENPMRWRLDELYTDE